jgi:hypothetical protein
LVDHPTTKTPKRSRADEILEEAELKAARRMKGSGAQEPVLITPRELDEDEAVGNGVRTSVSNVLRRHQQAKQKASNKPRTS